MQHFHDMVNNCGFMDLGFHGPKFTWCNKTDTQVRIWERLVKALANSAWARLYEDYKVENLSLVDSDHRPILLDTNSSFSTSICFIFRLCGLAMKLSLT